MLLAVLLATRNVEQVRKVAKVYPIDRHREISPRQYRYEDGRYRRPPGTNERHSNVAKQTRLTKGLLPTAFCQMLSSPVDWCRKSAVDNDEPLHTVEHRLAA